MHFPGFHVDAVNMLLEETEAGGVGVDTLSIDYGLSADFATHYRWLPSNRWAVENMANLDQLPATGATLVVGAPKHAGHRRPLPPHCTDLNRSCGKRATRRACRFTKDTLCTWELREPNSDARLVARFQPCPRRSDVP